MNLRGVIEGFYGEPWSHEERLDLLAFCGRHGLNTWVHAPKDDPYHRKRWRDPYPDEELERFAELARDAARHGVELVWAIAPGLSLREDDASELEALDAKRDQLRGAGVETFQLLWDDIERDALKPERQAEIANEFSRGEPLVVCPMGYAGNERTPYRDAFAAQLDAQIVVYWTGPEVVPETITRDDLEAAADAFHGHELLLWDNYPVNDFDVERLFLAPLRGREPSLADGVAGIVANGMLQAVPSKLALATVADYARDPACYDPVTSFEQAVAQHGAEVVEALRPATARADVPRPRDIPALVDALAPGVDAATAVALLEPFV